MFVSGADSTYNQIIGRVVIERVREGGGEGMGKLYYQKLRNQNQLSETQKCSFRHSRTFLHCYRCDNTLNGNYVE